MERPARIYGKSHESFALCFLTWDHSVQKSLWILNIQKGSLNAIFAIWAGKLVEFRRGCFSHFGNHHWWRACSVKVLREIPRTSLVKTQCSHDIAVFQGLSVQLRCFAPLKDIMFAWFDWVARAACALAQYACFVYNRDCKAWLALHNQNLQYLSDCIAVPPWGRWGLALCSTWVALLR